MVLKDLKLRLRRRRLRQQGLVVEVDVPKVMYGRRGSGAWTVHPNVLTADSVVYSFGVGRDVSWDMAMIRHHGLTVHAFDPTPGSVEWVQQQNFPPQFQFHTIGIAAHDGHMQFFPPRTTRTVHFSPIDRGFAFDPTCMVRAPVQRLRTIMRDLNHSALDVLKLDIEGGEYDVLPDVLESGISIGQILVEFHHNYHTLTMDHTHRAVRLLRDHGYRIFDISHRALEFSFIGPRMK